MMKVTIAIGTVFQDAGDATRAIEIAKGIKEYRPSGVEARIVFLSRGSRFEQKALDAGFEIYHADPKMSGVGMHQDLKPAPERGELIGERSIAIELLKGEIKAYKEIRPDIVLHGFWPIAGLARRMMEKEIPGICFVPLPLTEAFLDVIPDVPEQIKLLSMLPYKIRIGLFRSIPKFIKKRIPLLRQKNIRDAACELGWKGEPLLNLFSLLKADLTLVNDLPDYYDQSFFPKNVMFTGPVFSRSGSAEPVSPQVKEVFDPQNGKIKIFCTLGSSGTRKQLLEIIKVFTKGDGLGWNAVILSPSSVCPFEEAKTALGDRKGVYITDEFVPAQKVNALADIVICHGGQGTIQTALSSGTPLVGIAMQQEQFINLSNVAFYSAGIRIPFNKWNADNIRGAVKKIIADKRFKESALRLRERVNAMDGKKKSAEIIWNKIKELSLC
ncbi:MAG: nucleotide disphospho-sugar-binding domain-containing protein [Candidatus Omnitrophota bacterium]|jgi:UDP:flavonoid glycosyltransferase YjiC (YdhE family)